MVSCALHMPYDCATKASVSPYKSIRSCSHVGSHPVRILANDSLQIRVLVALDLWNFNKGAIRTCLHVELLFG